MDFYTAMGSRLERESGPLSSRLRNAFAAAFEDGLLVAGSALPAEREMAEGLGVSRSTLRQCLKELGNMGLVSTRPGAGTVVSGRIHKALSQLSGFTEDMKLRGLTATSTVLERLIGPVPHDTAFRTGLPLGTLTMTLVRLRKAGGETLCYEKAVVPISAVGEDYDGTGSLYERMDQRNGRPRRILQSLKAIEASPEVAGLLGVRPNSAVLEIAQVGYGADGLAVEDAVSWYRGDRYQYVGEIKG